VLGAFPRLEDIPDDAGSWPVRPRGADRLAVSLRTHRIDALVVRDVATLRTDLPVTVEVGAARWRGPAPGLEALLGRLGVPEVLEALP
jgi:5'-3' exonuclease